MQNPEIHKGKTPNGGDYSELWYLDKNGQTAKNMADAKQCKVCEYKNSGELVYETYAFISTAERG